MNDSSILALYECRSERAVSETQQHYGGMLFTVAHNILGCREDAEECVNDVYLQAWNAIPPAKPTHFKAYLAALTRNAALNRLNAQHTAKRGGGQVPAVLDELAECVPDSTDVERTLDQKEVIGAIERFLHRIPKKHRRVFLLRYFSLMPPAEIAAALHLSENTVKSILKRTRAKLLSELGKEELL